MPLPNLPQHILIQSQVTLLQLLPLATQLLPLHQATLPQHLPLATQLLPLNQATLPQLLHLPMQPLLLQLATLPLHQHQATLHLQKSQRCLPQPIMLILWRLRVIIQKAIMTKDKLLGHKTLGGRLCFPTVGELLISGACSVMSGDRS